MAASKWPCLVRGSPLSQKENLRCANLAPAGTATQTLSHHLRESGFEWTHHSHAFDCSHLQAAATRYGQPDLPCFLVTLRDPLRRLLSGFAFEEAMLGHVKFNAGAAAWPKVCQDDELCRYFLPGRPMLSAAPTLEAFVSALRGVGAPESVAAARSVVNASLTPTFTMPPSSGRHWANPAGGFVVDGSPFLVPLSFYVRGDDGACCRPGFTRMHLLCTEPSLEEDIATLLKLNASSKMARFGVRVRAGGHAGALSAAATAFVRHSLFANDTALVGGWCGGRAVS